MSSAGDSSPARDDLRSSVGELFSIFQRLFGTRWAATFADAKARPTWLAAFRHAGLTPVDVRRGLARASVQAWPPTCGEFMDLCRDDAPTMSAAIEEAVRWARDEVFTWSHPAIGATARTLKSWFITNSTERVLRDEFGRVYTQMLDRHRRGERLDVPLMRALPKEVRKVTPPGQPPPLSVRAEIDRLTSLLRVSDG